MDGVTFDALRYRSGEATGEGLGEEGRNGGQIPVRAA